MAFEEDTPKLFESWQEERTYRMFLFWGSAISLFLALFFIWGWAGVFGGAGYLGLMSLRVTKDDYYARWDLDPATGKPKV